MAAQWDFTGALLPAGATLTRAAGPSSRTAANRRIQSSQAADVARFDHDPGTGVLRGLLYEPAAATNACRNSADVGGTAWNRTGLDVARPGLLAPDGSAAPLLVPTTAGGLHQTSANDTLAVTAGARITKSIYVAPGGYRYLRLSLPATLISGGRMGLFDLVSRTAMAQGDAAVTISDGPLGFVRCSLTAIVTASGTTGTGAWGINAAWAFGDDSFAGDGSSGIYAWGAQVEIGTAASTYVEVGATGPDTRLAETLTLDGESGNYRITFDDLSTQTLTLVASGAAVTVPQLMRRRIRSVTHTVPAVTPAGRIAPVLYDLAPRVAPLA